MTHTDPYAALGRKKHITSRIGFALAAMIGLAGCATGGSDGDDAIAASTPSIVRQINDGEQLLFGEIQDAVIPPGKCGMILWTLHDQAPRPVFVYVVGESARAVLNNTQQELSLTEVGGTMRFGVAARQTFQTEEGIVASIRVGFGLGFEGGQYLEEGVVTLSTPDGWRAVTPTAGLIGCRRKA